MAGNKDKVKKNKTFFKDFKAELKKVTWPTPKQVVNNTIGVVIIVIIVAIIVFALDLAFESVNKYGINKLKGIVENTTSVEENVVDNTVESNTISNNTENQVDNTTNQAADTTNNIEQ